MSISDRTVSVSRMYRCTPSPIPPRRRGSAAARRAVAASGTARPAPRRSSQRVEDEAPGDAEARDDRRGMPGPTMRARLKPLELSAMASGRSSRPTSSIIIAWRAGISTTTMSRRCGEREQPPIVMRPRHGEPPEHRRLEPGRRLGDAHEAQLVRPIDERAAGIVKSRIGMDDAAAHEAHEERAVGQLERQPALRHGLHPGADQRQRLADPEERKFRCGRRTRNGLIGTLRGDSVTNSQYRVGAAMADPTAASQGTRKVGAPPPRFPTFTTGSRRWPTRSISSRCSTSSPTSCSSRASPGRAPPVLRWGLRRGPGDRSLDALRRRSSRR